MTSQTVYRAEHKKNYTTIGNDLTRNTDLSLEARFLHISLLTLPKSFKITIRGLVKILVLGKDLIGNALKELIKHGYVVREQVREKGIIREWITKVFERPNLDSESTVTRSGLTRSGSTRSGETGHIESKDQTNFGSKKVNIKTPPTSSKIQEEEEQKIEPFLGIKSNSQLLTTFRVMLRPLFNGITDLVDQLSAAPPTVEKPKINPPNLSTDTQAPIATASVLRKLSEITGEGIESLRTNLGLQKTLEKYAHNLEGVLQYLEIECKSFKPGIGLVVMALREGRKATKAGGATWKEWADRAFAESLISYSTIEGNDILIVFKNGETLLWSKAQAMPWDEVRAIALEDKF